MGRTLRVALSVAVLIAVMAPAARGADEPGLDGIYALKGLNPAGTEYRGVVAVVHERDTFVVTWMAPYSDGETMALVPIAVGIGIRDGEMLAVSYFDGETAGIVLYRIEDEGRRLAGRWVVAGGDGKACAQTLTKLPGEVSEPAAPEPSDDVKPDVPHRSTGPSAHRAI